MKKFLEKMSKRLQKKNTKNACIKGLNKSEKSKKKVKKMAKNVEKKGYIWYKYKVEKR